MEIVYIKAAKARGYLRLGIKDGEKTHDFTVSEREYAESGSPRRADILTGEAFSLLALADMRFRAHLKASRLLSYVDNSEKMLILKLCRSGISREVAVETARLMVTKGYVNDLRQLKRLILSETAKLYGPRKFIPKLMAKGYSRSDIDIALDELTSEEELDLDAVREALLEKYPDIGSEERAVLLYKRGFYS